MKVARTIKFRPHRGGFDQAMRDMIEVSSYAELVEVVKKQWPFDYDAMEIQGIYYGYDDRADWKHTWMILIKLNNKGRWYPIGYTNGNIKHLT